VADLRYLLRNRKIVRTQSPPNTDLKHYFEVMNTRGEQLEKYDILKARLIEKLETQHDQVTVSRLWDACSQLHRHIQVQFSVDSERSAIFGDYWNAFVPQGSVMLFENLNSADEYDELPCKNNGLRLLDPLKEEPTRSDTSKDLSDEEAGSYGSIVDFTNLLLHVLDPTERRILLAQGRSALR